MNILKNKYMIKRTNGKESLLKLWYRDENIVFDNVDQIKEFIKEFPIFFKDVNYIVMDVSIPMIKINNYILYSDLIKDERYLNEKKNINHKYIIKGTNNRMISINEYVIIFDDEDEINEFVNLAQEIFMYTDYEVIDETSRLAWYLYIDYKRLTPIKDDFS